MYNMDTNLYELANDEYECDEVNSVTVEVDVLNDNGFQWGNTLVQKDIVDWSQLQYQNQYHNFNYIASKFRGDWSNIPGFDKVIEYIAGYNKLTPMEEMEERYNVAEIHNEPRYDTNISEFQDC